MHDGTMHFLPKHWCNFFFQVNIKAGEQKRTATSDKDWEAFGRRNNNIDSDLLSGELIREEQQTKYNGIAFDSKSAN